MTTRNKDADLVGKGKKVMPGRKKWKEKKANV